MPTIGSTAAPWSAGGNGGWSTFVRELVLEEARARFMPPLCEKTLPYPCAPSFRVRSRAIGLLELLEIPCAHHHAHRLERAGYVRGVFCPAQDAR